MRLKPWECSMCTFVAVLYGFETVNEVCQAKVAYHEVYNQVTAWQNDVEHGKSGLPSLNVTAKALISSDLVRLHF